MERDSFRVLLVPFAAVFSQPSFHNFVVLLEGWVLAGMRAMTSTALASLGEFPKHFATYYRFFSEGVWCPDGLGLALLRVVLPFAPPGPVAVVVDDTIARKTGKHIWGANVHHDPLGFVPNALCFGHNWVVLAIVIRVPLVERFVAVPVYWRLYRSRKARTGATRRGRRESKTTGATCAKDHRTRPELAVELLHLLRCTLGCDRAIHVIGDSAYGGKSVTRHLPERTVCISRLPMSAALYALPSAPPQGQHGRPRKKGQRVPSPEQMAQDPNPWSTASVRLYGKDVRVRYKTTVGLWYNSAHTTPLRIVVVRDPKSRRKDEAFFSTDPAMTVQTILETYAKRWCLEVAFREVKQQLGFERSQARTKKAVQRTGPFAFVAYTVTVAWFCHYGHRHYPTLIRIMPWYRHKRAPSFADMHHLLRTTLLHQRFSHTPVNMHPFEKPVGINNHTYKCAA
jgi:hypothetical protein